ncbi:hypothetical protein CLV98_102333 [Dyadobacter jejuensis]|uniref:Uncharacterized protein n=1 Tax=Dyadobacter jejuensis TaxID=1082580 RepID=A0A316AQE8_9BACT|nr:hypothetical protein [Dyadobacter jejuensis]PWJ59499.1 hypothetical protein CLV98_102333 [Dyadobacter jejuensis]
MNRNETDKEARATKNTKNVWKYILGVGVVLMLIAFFGGYFNHEGNFKESENNTGVAADSSYTGEVEKHTDADTIMDNIRGTE